MPNNGLHGGPGGKARVFASLGELLWRQAGETGRWA